MSGGLWGGEVGPRAFVLTLGQLRESRTLMFAHPQWEMSRSCRQPFPSTAESGVSGLSLSGAVGGDRGLAQFGGK